MKKRQLHRDLSKRVLCLAFHQPSDSFLDAPLFLFSLLAVDSKRILDSNSNNKKPLVQRDASLTSSRMFASFTTSHIKQLVESRKTHFSGSESPSLTENRRTARLDDDIKSLEESIRTEVGSEHQDVRKRNAVASKIAISFYQEALDACLSQAMDLDTESNWWREVESKRRNTAMYLLQSESDY